MVHLFFSVLSWVVWLTVYFLILPVRLAYWIWEFGPTLTFLAFVRGPVRHWRVTGADVNPDNIVRRWEHLQLWGRPAFTAQVFKGSLLPPVQYCRYISRGVIPVSAEDLGHDRGHLLSLGSLPPGIVKEIGLWAAERLVMLPAGDAFEHLWGVWEYAYETRTVTEPWENLVGRIKSSLGRELRVEEVQQLKALLPPIWPELAKFFDQVEALGEIEWWDGEGSLAEMERRLENTLGERFTPKMRRALRARVIQFRMGYILSPYAPDFYARGN